MNSYTKMTILVCVMIAFVTGAFYYLEMEQHDSTRYLNEPLEFGEVTWPKGSIYIVGDDGDIVIELVSEFEALDGKWSEGTKFYFSADEVEKIIAPAPFEFAQLKFNVEAEIKKEIFDPHVLHLLRLKKGELIIDGLDLHKDCVIQFKNLVPYGASCPEFEMVNFKRSVVLPEVKSKP
ncbi:MAG: hypothetical protein QF441_16090 [Bacteriovoracaceae bacterium]|nr:hypothetical protein [Halobacteriovoraceae bacterium]MDP7322126.1 hypothetical protein [Bacteriovoracaceae bacterium]